MVRKRLPPCSVTESSMCSSTSMFCHTIPAWTPVLSIVFNCRSRSPASSRSPSGKLTIMRSRVASNQTLAAVAHRFVFPLMYLLQFGRRSAFVNAPLHWRRSLDELSFEAATVSIHLPCLHLFDAFSTPLCASILLTTPAVGVRAALPLPGRQARLAVLQRHHHLQQQLIYLRLRPNSSSSRLFRSPPTVRMPLVRRRDQLLRAVCQ